ncbi:MAG: adenosylcobinamide-GDP ribazoletransferase, partial [Halodesulfurarchaeum sp.]
MFVAAIRGGLGFLTALPIGRTEADWDAFVSRPGVIPVVGYVVGSIIALPFLLPLPAPFVGFLFVLAVYLATGINHVDGLLDVADGVSTHG